MPGTKLPAKVSIVGFVVVILLGIFLATFLIAPIHEYGIFLWKSFRGSFLVSDRIVQFGPTVELRLRPAFEHVGMAYPPQELTYIAFKASRRLEVYARMSSDLPWQFIKDYPILEASGTLGPKLVEADYQVPEGIYNVEFLNPNSRFHLSIRLDYPNGFDMRMAAHDKRTKLGSDIMIHGSTSSVGCIAVGDQAIEDLFILAAVVSPGKVKVIISPIDFRVATESPQVRSPSWVLDLYSLLRDELQQFARVTHQVN